MSFTDYMGEPANASLTCGYRVQPVRIFLLRIFRRAETFARTLPMKGDRLQEHYLLSELYDALNPLI